MGKPCHVELLKGKNTGMPSMPTTFSGMPRNIREPSNNPLSESFIENSKTKPDVYASQNFQSYTSPSQKYRNLSPAHAYVPFHSDILPQDFRQSATYQERQYSPRSYSTQRSPQSCTFGGQTYTTEIGQLLQPTTADPSTVSLDWEAYHTPSSSPILNPRALIHEFATQNYVEPDPPRGYDYVGITGREMRNNTSPHDLATVIRNQSLTPTQREANLYQTSTIRYDRTPFDGHKIYEVSSIFSFRIKKATTTR
uniref:ZM domain-containing protein n=1 Tax=Angiostrongylus cantonensis TaxID=6313 RepID=A0A158P620_ANGCA